MPITVVLAVGLDLSPLTAQNPVWKSAGYVITPAASISEAIAHFRAGDFDLVLLGLSISIEHRERLTFLIRATGSETPVVCIAQAAGDCDSFADATLVNESSVLLSGMGQLLADKARKRAALTLQYNNAN